MLPLSPLFFAVPMLHSAVPNITLCNYTINVHKGCGPSRDWILTARHVPDNTLQVANFGMMCVDETTCASKAMSADAAAEVCAAAKLCAGQGGARVINAQSGYALADGQDCCSEGEVSLQGSQMGNCTPSPPLYMCIEETGCSYCPHPLYCPYAVPKEQCEDTCNPTYLCVEGSCQPCPDPYNCPGAMSLSKCNSSCSAPTPLFQCIDDGCHQCADPSHCPNATTFQSCNSTCAYSQPWYQCKIDVGCVQCKDPISCPNATSHKSCLAKYEKGC